MLRKYLFLGWVVVVFSFGKVDNLNADTVYLKNGRSIEGLVNKESREGIELDVGFGTIKFRLEEVESIRKSSAEEAATLYQKWEKKKIENKQKMEEQKLASPQKAQPKAVSVEYEKGQIMVDALLNKKVSANLLLDTGASIVLLSRKIGEQLGPDSKIRKQIIELQFADGRKVKADYVVLNSLSVQGMEANNVSAAVLSEDTGNISYKDGLLGMSFLKNFNFKIDHKDNKLILEKVE